MTGMDRRAFFKTLLPEVIVSNNNKNYNSDSTVSVENPRRENWIQLGPIAAFDVNTVTQAQIANEEYFIESLSEGIRVSNKNKNIFYQLKMGSNGQLFININEQWPNDSVLSILTGEIYQV